MVLVRAVFVSLHVVSVYERFNSLFQISRLHREFQLIVQFRNQEIVPQSLSHLHYPDDGCVDLVLPVLEHPLRGADLLLHLRDRRVGLGRAQGQLSPPWSLNGKLLMKHRPNCGRALFCYAVLFVLVETD